MRPWGSCLAVQLAWGFYLAVVPPTAGPSARFEQPAGCFGKANLTRAFCLRRPPHQLNRFPTGPIANHPYMLRVVAAHKLHHTDKYGGVPFGLFLGPQVRRAPATLARTALCVAGTPCQLPVVACSLAARPE
jgi:hypothetical protein